MDVILYSKIAKLIEDSAGYDDKSNTWSADKLMEQFSGGSVSVKPTLSIVENKFIQPDGTPSTTATDWYYCDYVNISKANEKKVTISSTIYGNYASTAWYNASKQLIGYINATNASDYGITPDTNAQEYTITLPDDAVYVRFNVWVNGTSTLNNLYVKYFTRDASGKNKLFDYSKYIGEMRWTNLIDPAQMVESAYIRKSDGALIGNNIYNNATGFVYLHPNTLYYVHNIMLDNNNAFYMQPDEATFVASPDVTITYSATPAWLGTIETHGTGYFFRGTNGKDAYYKNPYISQYEMRHTGHEMITLDERMKHFPDCVRNKVLIIGDSISTDAYGSYKKWVSYLLDERFFPADTTNSSQHATGFVARYDSQPNDFISRITNIQSKDKFDMVIVFGGINDFIQNVPMGGGSGETDRTVYFKPAVDYFFQYLIENFTQARICVLSPLRTYNNGQNSVGQYETDYADYIKEVAKSYCLPVLNLTEESGFCPYISVFKNRWTLVPSGYEVADGVHPNAEYMEKFLTPMIKKFLCNL